MLYSTYVLPLTKVARDFKLLDSFRFGVPLSGGPTFFLHFAAKWDILTIEDLGKEGPKAKLRYGSSFLFPTRKD